MADAVRIKSVVEKLKEQNPNPFRYEKISGLLNHIAKFALDSAFIHPLKSPTGRKEVKKVEQQELRYKRPFPVSFNEPKKQEDVKLVVMEKVQENMNNVKQQHETAAECVAGRGALEDTSGGGFKGSDLLQNQRKKVFIRSRL